MRRRTLLARNEGDELDLTAMINMMVILVCFLLTSAVFSRITVLELNMPPAAQASSSSAPQPKKELLLEVILRKNAIEINDRNGSFFERINNLSGGYDIKSLAQNLHQLKARFPEKRDASILLEDDIPYDLLVQVMDALREERSGAMGSAELFPEISIGDAPAGKKIK